MTSIHYLDKYPTYTICLSGGINSVWSYFFSSSFLCCCFNVLCFLQIKLGYCIPPNTLFTQENNTKAPVLLCHIGPPNKEAMIERMKTTEVSIKDGWKTAGYRENSRWLGIWRKTHKRHTQSDFQKSVLKRNSKVSFKWIYFMLLYTILLFKTLFMHF